jgi:hypothetical protein
MGSISGGKTKDETQFTEKGDGFLNFPPQNQIQNLKVAFPQENSPLVREPPVQLFTLLLVRPNVRDPSFAEPEKRKYIKENLRKIEFKRSIFHSFGRHFEWLVGDLPGLRPTPLARFIFYIISLKTLCICGSENGGYLEFSNKLSGASEHFKKQKAGRDGRFTF